jgi:hypothetical protein
MIRMIQEIRCHVIPMITDTINHKPQRAILSASWGFLLPSCCYSSPIPTVCCMGLPNALTAFLVSVYDAHMYVYDGFM